MPHSSCFTYNLPLGLFEEAGFFHYDYRSRYGWYGAPFFPYGGGCGWLYRNAKATRAPYWWNRYHECIGYY